MNTPSRVCIRLVSIENNFNMSGELPEKIIARVLAGQCEVRASGTFVSLPVALQPQTLLTAGRIVIEPVLQDNSELQEVKL